MQHIYLFLLKLLKKLSHNSQLCFSSAFVCAQMCHLFLTDLLQNILKGFRVSIECDLLQWIFQPRGILWSNGLLSNFTALSSIVPPHYLQKWFSFACSHRSSVSCRQIVCTTLIWNWEIFATFSKRTGIPVSVCAAGRISRFSSSPAV